MPPQDRSHPYQALENRSFRSEADDLFRGGSPITAARWVRIVSLVTWSFLFETAYLIPRYYLSRLGFGRAPLRTATAAEPARRLAGLKRQALVRTAKPARFLRAAPRRLAMASLLAWAFLFQTMYLTRGCLSRLYFRRAPLRTATPAEPARRLAGLKRQVLARTAKPARFLRAAPRRLAMASLLAWAFLFQTMYLTRGCLSRLGFGRTPLRTAIAAEPARWLGQAPERLAGLKRQVLARTAPPARFLRAAPRRLATVPLVAWAFVCRALYRTPRGWVSRPNLLRAARRGGARLRLLLEDTIGPADRFLSAAAEKLDRWSVPQAARAALGRAATAAWRAGRPLGAAAQTLGRRYAGSRLSGFPPARWLMVAALALAMVAVPYERLWAKNALEITYGGRFIAQAAGTDEFWTALHQVEMREKELYGSGVVLAGVLKVVPIHSDARSASPQALGALLAHCLRFVIPAAGISVDGQLKVVVRNRAAAEQTLADYTARYRVGGADVRFEEPVRIVPLTVPPPEVVSEFQALTCLNGTVGEPATYVVRSGDTLARIARQQHTSASALLAANPGLRADHLAGGQVINLKPVVHELNVLSTRRITSEVTVPYPVEVRPGPGLSYGERRVVQAGRPGRALVVTVVTAENGVAISRRIVQRNVLQAPAPEIERVGRGVAIASRGGGYRYVHLLWPARGSVTSPFGWRFIFGRREFHTGIDIGAPYGQPIRAADAGVVTFAGWESGYGRTVVISHGDRLSTLYAHMSRILVRRGERVRRDQELGRIGATGDAIGPHLHFEVRLGGVPVNPLPFL